MRFLLQFFLFSILSFSQVTPKKEEPKSLIKTSEQRAKEAAKKAPISSYKIISLEKDTIILDTSLSIKKEYEYNYLRKDIFGLLPFSNEGQTYNTLDFGYTKNSQYPEMGFRAKHFAYQEVNDIKYYSVATPITELYFKTVMEQGQNVDALITLNTSERLNVSIAFKGLRSLGKYNNQLSSTGNFRFTTSYSTLNKKYNLNFHYTGQDLLNAENGGITTLQDFEGEDKLYNNRLRLQVFLNNAKSFLKGKRFFINHSYRINTKNSDNNLYLKHQFNYEHKFFEYNQQTIQSTIGAGSNEITLNRFGLSIVNSNINDQVRYTKLYNKLSAVYENKLLGEFEFFVENFNYKYYYKFKNQVNNIEDFTITTYPNFLQNTINSIGGQYNYHKNKWNGTILYSNSISVIPLRNFDASVNYKFNEKNQITFQYKNTSKTPNHNFNLNNSSYVYYNWRNYFKNEKINSITINAQSQWVNINFQLTNLEDYLYFNSESSVLNVQKIAPRQYSNSINYLSVKVSKEFKYNKLALDNTVLFQKVDQQDNILNVPEITLRSTLYYSNFLFKKAMFLQTGVTLNYFTNYYANDYNPILGEFFVQNNKEIGNFPLVDFFINARIRQTRLFIKAEHLNSSFTGNNFYAAPNTPYRDFLVRFGLVWTFFQ